MVSRLSVANCSDSRARPAVPAGTLLVTPSAESPQALVDHPRIEPDRLLWPLPIRLAVRG